MGRVIKIKQQINYKAASKENNEFIQSLNWSVFHHEDISHLFHLLEVCSPTLQKAQCGDTDRTVTEQ